MADSNQTNSTAKLPFWGALAPFLMVAALAGRPSSAGSGAGPVIAVGGGGTPDSVPAWALAAARDAGHGSVDVIVIPHASSRGERGVGSADMWREAGADTAELLSDDLETARAQLDAAEIIWMGGGSQSRLLDHLERARLVEDLRAAHERGAIVGGTSAGAAVLGSTTIAGSPDPAPYLRGAVEQRPGLGLVPGTIVDQHFAERRREGRLLTAIIEGAERRGVGVSEGTAAVFQDGTVEIMGRASVLIFETPKPSAPPEDGRPGQALAIQGLRMDLLPAGTRTAYPPGLMAPAKGPGDR